MSIKEQPLMTSPIKIAVFAPLLNAGEAIRAFEIAKRIRKLDPTIDVRFFSALYNETDISYETHAGGFPVRHVGPGLSCHEWHAILQREHAGHEFLTNISQAKIMIEDSIQALREYQPSIVLHGMSPDGSLAAHILNIPNIAYVALPMTVEWTRENLLNDFPESDRPFWACLLPKPLRRKLVRWVALNPNIPSTLAEPTLRQAALESGWQRGDETSLLFDLVKAEQALLLDLPSNYVQENLPSNTTAVGPVFSSSSEAIPDEVLCIFSRDNRNKVFVSMGSSGEEQYLIEAAKAVCKGDFYAVVIVPPTTCSLEKLQEAVGTIPKHKVLLTNAFLPAAAVNALANVALIHGGQGTVQVALHAGTPIVGVDFQGEQEFNLKQVVRRGAGVRIPKKMYKAKRIVEELHRVLEDAAMQKCATAVQKELQQLDGPGTAAQHVVDFARMKAIV